MIYSFFNKYRKNKYVGYVISATIMITYILWNDNAYYSTTLLSFYLLAMLHNLYEKIQYVEGARPHIIYFSTVNNRLYNIPEISGPLFYVAIAGLLYFFDSDFLGPFGIYYLIGYTMVSIWSSFYGKMPSAYFSIDKEENSITCYDGTKRYETPVTAIQDITISSKSIILNTEQKKINLIHLSLNEKEVKLISSYCRSQLSKTAMVTSKEEDSITLQ